MKRKHLSFKEKDMALVYAIKRHFLSEKQDLSTSEVIRIALKKLAREFESKGSN